LVSPNSADRVTDFPSNYRRTRPPEDEPELLADPPPDEDDRDEPDELLREGALELRDIEPLLPEEAPALREGAL
jgi:hypothetical protein